MLQGKGLRQRQALRFPQWVCGRKWERSVVTDTLRNLRREAERTDARAWARGKRGVTDAVGRPFIANTMRERAGASPHVCKTSPKEHREVEHAARLRASWATSGTNLRP